MPIPPQMTPVKKSSHVESIGHDPATSTMYVRFKASGHLYAYPNTTALDYAKVLSAPSVGRHLGTVHANRGQKVE